MDRIIYAAARTVAQHEGVVWAVGLLSRPLNKRWRPLLPHLSCHAYERVL